MAGCLMLSGCYVTNTSHSAGQADEGYLLLVSGSDYSHPVSVTVDDNLKFSAKVIHTSKTSVKGDIYAIPTGSHHIVVTNSKGEVICDRTVFVSTQETKKVKLP